MRAREASPIDVSPGKIFGAVVGKISGDMVGNTWENTFIIMVYLSLSGMECSRTRFDAFDNGNFWAPVIFSILVVAVGTKTRESTRDECRRGNRLGQQTPPSCL